MDISHCKTRGELFYFINCCYLYYLPSEVKNYRQLMKSS